MAAIAAVDDGEIGHLVGQDGDLLQRRRQGVAIVGVAGKAAGPDNETLLDGGGKG